MGQRHQVFAIARVPNRDKKFRYRCVAAYQHQWCYGYKPLQATKRFMTLLKQPDNGDIVRAELFRFWPVPHIMASPEDNPYKEEVPCPYIAALLAMSWDVELTAEAPYLTGIEFRETVLEANKASCDGGVFYSSLRGHIDSMMYSTQEKQRREHRH